MSYQLVTKQSFDKEFAGLPKEIQRRVAAAFLGLRDNPFPPGCVKLKGTSSYRIRVGDYRIIYCPDPPNQIIRLLAVGHRREIYRRRNRDRVDQGEIEVVGLCGGARGMGEHGAIGQEQRVEVT